MIVECHLNFGYRSEFDLFLVQAVMQILTLRNRPAGLEFFKTYTDNHPFVVRKSVTDSGVQIYEQPLLNFTELLLRATTM
jgi:hypothetical protein